MANGFDVNTLFWSFQSNYCLLIYSLVYLPTRRENGSITPKWVCLPLIVVVYPKCVRNADFPFSSYQFVNSSSKPRKQYWHQLKLVFLAILLAKWAHFNFNCLYFAYLCKLSEIIFQSLNVNVPYVATNFWPTRKM